MIAEITVRCRILRSRKRKLSLATTTMTVAETCYLPAIVTQISPGGQKLTRNWSIMIVLRRSVRTELKPAAVITATP